MGLLLLDGSTPPAPPAPLVFVSAFGLLGAQMDQTAIELLGGVPVIYQPAAGPAVPVTGIFDDPYLLTQGNAEAGVETRAPTVFLQLADLPTDPMTDDPILTIGDVDYRVFARRPAGLGSIVLDLRKVL
jgi:hypothetical protein